MKNDIRKVIRHPIRNYEKLLMKAGGGGQELPT
jgi:hypothetical protein